MKITKTLLATLAVIASLSVGAVAQTYGETSREFRKFQAKIRAGLTYTEYRKSLGDLEFAVGEYVLDAKKPEEKVNAKLFQEALLKYTNAGEAWELYRAAERSDVVDQFSGSITGRLCPKAVVDKYLGIDACLNQNWSEARSLLETSRDTR